MSGHIFLYYITDLEIDALLTSGATLHASFQHCDKNDDASFVLLKGRLDFPNSARNRKGLPPHFYIKIPRGAKAFRIGSRAPILLEIMRRSRVPTSIVTVSRALEGWSGMTSEQRLLSLIKFLHSDTGTELVIEIYHYSDSEDGQARKIINANGEIDDGLAEYFKFVKVELVKEK